MDDDSRSFESYKSAEEELDGSWQVGAEGRIRRLWSRIKYNIEAAITFKNMTNLVFVMGVSAICLQQCYSQVGEYLKFETRIQVSHSFPNSTLWLLPGITICNNNRIRMEKLVQESDGLEDKLKAFMGVVNASLLQEQRRLDLMKEIKSIVDDTVNITKILTESPIPKLLQLSRTSMIRDINCNVIWGREFNCENFRIVESFQGNVCYTLFYQGALLEALTSGIAYDFSTSLLGGQRKIDSFTNHELVEVLVDFEPFEHADFYWDVGGKFVVHSTGHIGSVRDMAYSIKPGQSYDIVIRRQMSKRLPPPYKSKCFDYKSQNSAIFREREASFASIELDKTTCVRNCVAKQTTKYCKCWPIEIPYYLGDPLVGGSENLTLCEWAFEEGERNQTSATDKHKVCFKKFTSECLKQCKQGCVTEDYLIHVMSRAWPSKDMFFLANSENEMMELRRLKSCCAKLSVKYHEFMDNRNLQYPSVTLAQLVSNIGGVMSSLIGVSMVVVYRYLTRKILGCKVVGDYLPPDMLATGGRAQIKTKRTAKRLCVAHRHPFKSRAALRSRSVVAPLTQNVTFILKQPTDNNNKQ